MKLIYKGSVVIKDWQPPRGIHNWPLHYNDVEKDKNQRCRNCGVLAQKYYFADDKTKKKMDDACLDKNDKQKIKYQRNSELRKAKLESELTLDLKNRPPNP